MAGRLSAQEAWLAAQAVGRLTELASGRDALRAASRGTAPEVLAVARERVERRPRSIFDEYARDAAASFGDPAAAACVQLPLAAVIEAVRIIDDVQDDEPQCLATEIGTAAALEVAMAALAVALELTADLPLSDDAWPAAAIAIGRGIRETALGQTLEGTASPSFTSFWDVVDHKTPPLVATALELGALAAGATPRDAAALTRLAIPLGRLLQIGDDCHDALGPGAPDWHAPHANLLMLYGLSSPRGADLAALLHPATIVEAQHWLLREGALAYAIHAQLATLATLREVLATIARPDPAPLAARIARYEADTVALQRTTGVATCA